MRVNSISSPNFQKQLRATCAVVADDRSYPCKIYELNRDEDMGYFDRYLKTPEWFSSCFMFIAEKILDKNSCFKESVYVLENENEYCLGFCVLDERREGENVIDYIETMPQNTSKHKNRRLKYVGETLMAFMAKLTDKDDDKSCLSLESYLEEAYPFYEQNCGFQKRKIGKYKKTFLLWRDFDKLIKQNESHTGATIDFVY